MTYQSAGYTAEVARAVYRNGFIRKAAVHGKLIIPCVVPHKSYNRACGSSV